MNRFYLKHLLTNTHKFSTLLVLVCFGAMVGFSQLLHAHELELDHIHKNCAPCKWNQLQTNTKSEIASIVPFSHFLYAVQGFSQVTILTIDFHFSSRAPPSLPA